MSGCTFNGVHENEIFPGAVDIDGTTRVRLYCPKSCEVCGEYNGEVRSNEVREHETRGTETQGNENKRDDTHHCPQHIIVGIQDDDLPFHMGLYMVSDDIPLYNDEKYIITSENMIKIRYNYPLRDEVIYEHKIECKENEDKKRYITIGEFLAYIRSDYKRIYDEETEDIESHIVTHQIDTSRADLDITGRHGIWGHGIEDLVLEGVSYRDGIFNLSIGS